MDGFLCTNVDEEDAKQYSLKSLVYHIGGTASSGHYTADALRTRPAAEPDAAAGDTVTEWVSFDDSKTSVTKLSDIVASKRCQGSAYMLLYTMD